MNNDLIQPCKCSGSMKYIHFSCLQTWLMSKNNKVNAVCNESYSYYTIDKQLECELCKTKLSLSFKQNNKIYNLLDFLKSNYKQYIILESLQTASDKRKKPNIRCFYTINLFKKNEISIGRSGDAQVKFNDISISRIHCYFLIKNNEIYVKDNSSKFGTLIHFTPKSFVINPKSELLLQIGRTYHSFKYENSLDFLCCIRKIFNCENKKIETFDDNYYFQLNKKNLINIQDDEISQINCPDIHFSMITDADDEINNYATIDNENNKESFKNTNIVIIDEKKFNRRKSRNNFSVMQFNTNVNNIGIDIDYFNKITDYKKSSYSFEIKIDKIKNDYFINLEDINLEDINLQVKTDDKNKINNDLINELSNKKEFNNVNNVNKNCITVDNDNAIEKNTSKKFKTEQMYNEYECDLNVKENEIIDKLEKSKKIKSKMKSKDKLVLSKENKKIKDINYTNIYEDRNKLNDEFIDDINNYNEDYLKKLRKKFKKKKALDEKLQQFVKISKESEFKKINKNFVESDNRLAVSIDNRIIKNAIKKSLIEKGFNEKYVDNIVDNIGKKKCKDYESKIEFPKNENVAALKKENKCYSTKNVYDLNDNFQFGKNKSSKNNKEIEKDNIDYEAINKIKRNKTIEKDYFENYNDNINNQICKSNKNNINHYIDKYYNNNQANSDNNLVQNQLQLHKKSYKKERYVNMNNK